MSQEKSLNKITSSSSSKIKGKKYPKDPVPDFISLYFKPKSSDQNAKGVVWRDSCEKPHGSYIKVGQRKTISPPGWLIELSPPQIRVAYDLEDYLTNVQRENDVSPIVKKIESLISGLGVVDFNPQEITRALRYTPPCSKNGLDYRPFLLALGDFHYAKKHYAIRQTPRYFKVSPELDDFGTELEVDDDDDNEEDESRNDFESSDCFFKSESEIQKDFEPKDPPYPIRERDDYIPSKERRAMIQWHEKMKEEREVHNKKVDEWIDKEIERRKKQHSEFIDAYLRHEGRKVNESEKNKKEEEEKKLKKEEKLKDLKKSYIEAGFEPNVAASMAKADLNKEKSSKINAGKYTDKGTYTQNQKIFWSTLFILELYEIADEMKKSNNLHYVPHKVQPRHSAHFEKYLKSQKEMNEEKIKTSPYLAPFPFVINRIEGDISDPKSFKVKFDKFLMELPASGKGRIILSENKIRIQNILQYLFFKKRSALCLLPRVELILNFTNNIVDLIMNRPSKNESKKVHSLKNVSSKKSKKNW